MEGTSKPPTKLQFGVFTVDLRSGELYKQGARVKLQELPFRLLVALLSKPGRSLPVRNCAANFGPTSHLATSIMPST